MSTNLKVAALLAGQISIDGTWTTADFAELAVAAADQAGANEANQTIIASQLPGCPHENCGDFIGHRGRHSMDCDDGSCCEPRGEVDREHVAALRATHFNHGA